MLDTTAPSVPGNLRTTSVAAQRVDLAWNASSDNVGVVRYNILRNGAVIDTSTTTSYSDIDDAASPVLPNTTYTYNVNAVDAAGNTSGNSNTVTVTTPNLPDTEKPSVPANLRTTSVTSTQVDLAWDPSTDNVGVAGYYVNRDGVRIATVNTTTFGDSTVSPSTTYRYTVQAFDSAAPTPNVSAPSNQITVTTPAACSRVAPTASLSPNSRSGAAGSAQNYTFTVTNNDNSGCGSSTFTLAATVPAGWGFGFNPTSLTIPPSENRTSTFTVTSASGAAPNNYTVTARATNSAATSFSDSDSATYVVTDTTAPTVSITAPAGGAYLRGNVTVSATASDNIGVARVEFFKDSDPAPFATDTISPYSVIWDTTVASNGGHTLTAKAHDAAGNIGTSSAVPVTVDNIAPSVSITSPTSGSYLRGNITVSANASDNIGVARVEFFKDSDPAPFATDTVSPYSTPWNTSGVSNGSHNLTAKAYDAAGNPRTSAPVPVIVDNSPPSVSVTSPASGATVSGTAVTVAATASDNVGVSRVEFFKDSDAAPFATDSSSPYSVSWNSTTIPNGGHSLKAKAFDAAGNSTTSPAVPVTVANGGGPLPPTVNIKANGSNGPIEIAYNTAATLSWTSTNATSCTASGGWSGSKPKSGSASTGRLTSSKTFTLTCTGLGGSASDSVRVNVGEKGDLNLDDRVNIRDLSYLVSKWNTSDRTADINGSGRVDIRDLSILVSRWD